MAWREVGAVAIGRLLYPLGVHAVVAKPIKERGSSHGPRVSPTGASRVERADRAKSNASARILGSRDGVLRYICDRNFRDLRVDRASGQVGSAEGAYISVQKPTESSSEGGLQVFFSCVFPRWSQNVPAAAMRLHCGTTLGFDGG